MKIRLDISSKPRIVNTDLRNTPVTKSPLTITHKVEVTSMSLPERYRGVVGLPSTDFQDENPLSMSPRANVVIFDHPLAALSRADSREAGSVMHRMVDVEHRKVDFMFAELNASMRQIELSEEIKETAEFCKTLRTAIRTKPQCNEHVIQDRGMFFTRRKIIVSSR